MLRVGLVELCTDIGCNMQSITPYARCDHRCVYCCTGVQGRSVPMCSAEEAVDAVRRARDEIPEESRYFILGAFSDAYPSVESEHGITRAIVGELVRVGEPFTVVTKGDTILRDLDLLERHGQRAHVQVSICSTDDDVLRRIDSHAPSGTARFTVVDALRRAGVRVGVNVLPWIPDVTDTAALIARVPTDVEIVFAPLSFGEDGDSRELLGRCFTRDEVWQRYLGDYRRFGHVENTSWVRPSLPPNENHPVARLPRLPAAS